MKKRRIFLLILVAILAAVLLTACNTNTDAIDAPSELVYRLNEDGKTCTVTGVKGYADTELVIPAESPDGYAVTAIAEEAFIGRSNFTKITVPDSVETIGERAFFGCSTLESITLPFIGATKDGSGPSDFAYVFGDVPLSLRTLVITGGTTLPDRAFAYRANLTSITLPNTLRTIGQEAFFGCTGLTEIVIPDGVTVIGSVAFDHCTKLSSVTIPDSVTEIGSCAFAYCTGLQSTIYRGTVSQWNLIKNKSSLFYCAGNNVIRCTNGLVTD